MPGIKLKLKSIHTSEEVEEKKTASVSWGDLKKASSEKKLDLSAIRNSALKEPPEEGKEKDIMEPTLAESQDNITLWEQEQSSKINLSNIRANKKDEEKEKQETLATKNSSIQVEVIQKDKTLSMEEKKVGNEKMFWNYESHFEKKSQKFLDRIKKFTSTPKTRVWLLLFLIISSISVLWGLMYFMPEKHSLSVYKANILEIYDSQFWRKLDVSSAEAAISETKRESIPEKQVIQEESLILPKKDIPVQKNTIKKDNKQKLKEHLLKNYQK